MPYSRDVFASQMPAIDAFVKHLVCHRVLNQYIGRLPKQAFWSLTSDAHLLEAIICWCKVFGAKGTNETHWQQLDKADVAKLKDSFRSELQKQLGLDMKAWSAYHTEVTDFRNRFAAHSEIGFSQPVPRLDTALKIAYFYDDWVRGAISPDTLDDPPLRDLASGFENITDVYLASIV